MTVSLEFLAAQLQRVIDKLDEHDGRFRAIAAEAERAELGIRRISEQTDALRAMLEGRLNPPDVAS